MLLTLVAAKSLLILGAALLLVRRERFSAAQRHLLLALTMASLPLLLILSLLGASVVSIDAPRNIGGWTFMLELSDVPVAASAAANAASVPLWSQVGPAGWYTVVAVALIGWWLIQMARASRWIGRHTVRDGERRRKQASGRTVTLRRSALAVSPFTWGMLRPIVVVPPDWPEWPPARRQAVMTHEMAHVARWDTLVSAASLLIACAFWINPLVWIVHRRLLAEAELACDDAVVNGGVAAAEYAGELLSLARVRVPPLAHAAGSEPTLSRRIRALVDPATRRTTMSGAKILATMLAAAVLIGPIMAIDARAGADADRAVPAIGSRYRAALQDVQALTEAEAFDEALAAATALADTAGNGNEAAQIHNMLGFLYFSKDDYETSLAHYLRVLAHAEDTSRELELQTLFTAAQLSFVVERYAEAITHIEAWQKLADGGVTKVVPHIFIGQAHYQLADYQSAITAVRTGLDLAEVAGEPVKENWLALLAHLYCEEQQLDACLRVTEELQRQFPDDRYDRRVAALKALVG